MTEGPVLFEVGDPSREPISAAKVAQMYGVDIRSVQYWDSKGWITRKERGLYILGDVIRGVYEGQLSVINKKQGESGGKRQDLELSKLEEQVKQLQIENDKLTGKLRDAEKVRRVAFSRAKSINGMMDAAPSRLKAILAAETDELVIGQKLKEEFDRIRNENIDQVRSLW